MRSWLRPDQVRNNTRWTHYKSSPNHPGIPEHSRGDNGGEPMRRLILTISKHETTLSNRQKDSDIPLAFTSKSTSPRNSQSHESQDQRNYSLTQFTMKSYKKIYKEKLEKKRRSDMERIHQAECRAIKIMESRQTARKWFSFVILSGLIVLVFLMLK